MNTLLPSYTLNKYISILFSMYLLTDHNRGFLFGLFSSTKNNKRQIIMQQNDGVMVSNDNNANNRPVNKPSHQYFLFPVSFFSFSCSFSLWYEKRQFLISMKPLGEGPQGRQPRRAHRRRCRRRSI